MTTSFLLTDDNRAKLKTLADELGVKPNRAINLLIQNARIGEVQRSEPVAVLSKKNSAQKQNNSPAIHQKKITVHSDQASDGDFRE